MMKRILPLLALVALPGAALAAPVWSSNFENGAVSADWSKAQMVAPDRMTVVTNPVKEGSKAMAVTVHQGDDPVNCGNDRAELVRMTNEPPNSEYWYHWNVLFPADYPSSPKWQLFTQWHQNGLNGSPPVEIYVVGEEMRLRTGGNEGPVIWTAPLQRGQWQDFVFHVKWSSDPSVGFVELWHNGQPELPKTMTATQLPGDVNYLKMGLYRAREIAQPATIYFDDIRMGTDQADVMPAAQPAQAQQAATNPEGTQTPAAGGDATATASNTPAATTAPGTGVGGSSTSGQVMPTTTDPNGPTGGLSGGPTAGADAQGGCSGSASGAGALPAAFAMALIAATALFRRRRAEVTVPIRRTDRR